jgi:hypothetical protein
MIHIRNVTVMTILFNTIRIDYTENDVERIKFFPPANTADELNTYINEIIGPVEQVAETAEQTAKRGRGRPPKTEQPAPVAVQAAPVAVAAPVQPVVAAPVQAAPVVVQAAPVQPVEPVQAFVQPAPVAAVQPVQPIVQPAPVQPVVQPVVVAAPVVQAAPAPVAAPVVQAAPAPVAAPVVEKVAIELAREQVAVCVNNQLPIYEVEKVKDTWPDNQPLPNTLAITNGKMSDPLTRNVVLSWANEATGANSGARPTPHMVSILHAATMTLAHQQYAVLTPDGREDVNTKAWFVATVRRYMQEKSQQGITELWS